MIFLFTDFGHRASYVGQMRTVLARACPEVAVIELTAHAPAFDPFRSAYWLAAELPQLGADDIMLAVVDPGVGTARAALAVRCDERWLIGPDNGLFAIAMRRASKVQINEILWRPEILSVSFHGRDLFAPVAAKLATGEEVALGAHTAVSPAAWPDDLAEVIFIDDYGNAMTGLRARQIPTGSVLTIAGVELNEERTFADGKMDEAFWYVNSLGLVEISARNGSASALLGLRIGSELTADALSPG
ncbi:MAG: S-adenosyl-l-methionine hydroxide adenosyltransferase family protein [Geminicoccaceae bacterium]